MPTLLSEFIPGLVVRSPNVRCHWGVRHRLNKRHAAALAVLARHGRPDINGGLAVTLTRVGGKTMDGDNLAGAFKKCRDEVAAWLIPGLPPGKADGDPRLTFQYSQRPRRRGEPAGVLVEITEGNANG